MLFITILSLEASGIDKVLKKNSLLLNFVMQPILLVCRFDCQKKFFPEESKICLPWNFYHLDLILTLETPRVSFSSKNKCVPVCFIYTSYTYFQLYPMSSVLLEKTLSISESAKIIQIWVNCRQKYLRLQQELFERYVNLKVVMFLKFTYLK